MAEKEKKTGRRAVKIGKTAAILAAALVFAALIGLLYLTAVEYIPDAYSYPKIENEGTETVSLGQEFTVLSWNIGYAGLGEKADFFMDGGKNVTSYDKAGVQDNLDQIIETLKAEDADAVLLQETDVDSSRSYGINESGQIGDALSGCEYAFAYNYKAVYVPYPIPTIGRVQSGITTLTKYNQTSATRISLPCPFTWPIRVANLKRCLLVSRIPIEGSDEELVLINLHLEAYDSGEGKAAQTRELMELFKGEVEKGNYVIAGGDFNQTFSGIDLEDSCAPLISEDYWQPGIIDESEFQDFADLYMDDSVPSCRSLDKVLAESGDSDFQYYIIDGFIVSHNITVEDFKTLDLGFQASDHNPIEMTVILNEEN